MSIHCGRERRERAVIEGRERRKGGGRWRECGKVGMMKGHKGGIVEGQESNVCLYERCEEAMAK